MGKDLPSQNKNGVSVVLCGQAGMGIQTVEHLLTKIFKLAGHNVFSTKEYMSRIRGGTNSTEIRISAYPVRAFIDRIDILVPLNKGAVQHVGERISSETVVLAEKENLGDDFDRHRSNCIDVPFTRIAAEIGDKVYSNTVAVGAITGLFGINREMIDGCIRRFFATKADEVIKKNIQAAGTGHKIGTDLANSQKLRLDISSDSAVQNQILLRGAEAIALGAIAGGCNFISAYPMSPATSVLVFLAKHAEDFGIIAEQAEDEIAAMNMAVGAWYAGARAMVSTSGGGFALMTEGLSLAAMLETPIVIHLGQRPGPATGLPTRTEQADLELVLYAGHGEFPRIILAPGKLEDAFYLTARAFNLADKYQAPVFILTDQYFLDSYYNIAPFDLSDVQVKKHLIKTRKDYERYELTADGISPRGIPGFGKGLVVVDSDEHDTQGHITEDLDIRTKMVDKRLKKAESIADDIIPPELTGPDDYKTLIVCWGSTYNVVTEAVKNLAGSDVSFLHFRQVYPLHRKTVDYLRNSEKIIIIENNATSQFAKLIKLHTGIDIDNKILKYNGLSFTVEELTERLSKVLD